MGGLLSGLFGGIFNGLMGSIFGGGQGGGGLLSGLFGGNKGEDSPLTNLIGLGSETQQSSKSPSEGVLSGLIRSLRGTPGEDQKAPSSLSDGLDLGTSNVGMGLSKILGGASSMLGDISAKYESGKSGPGTISSGRGDPGGVSYGTHQLASKTGTLQRFLRESGYGDQFAGMSPGTQPFNAKWKELAQDSAFGDAQRNFIKKTHYDPLRQYASSRGIMDHPAVNEALFSMGVQHGGAKRIIDRAGITEDDDPSTAIQKLYDARRSYVSGVGGLSSTMKQSLMRRYDSELQDVMGLL